MSQQHDTPGQTPLFNIGAVSRMTDIPEATLRAWERRYDFPKSARTSGGHRLYSQQEVMRLQWVKQQLDQGIQVSQAIRALQQTERDNEKSGTTVASLPYTRRAEASRTLNVFHH